MISISCKRIAALVFEEDVVATPQEGEGGHRYQEMRAARHFLGIVAQQPAIVVDMLQHVHHQHEVAVGRAGVATVVHRLAGDAVVTVRGIADVDAERTLGR